LLGLRSSISDPFNHRLRKFARTKAKGAQRQHDDDLPSCLRDAAPDAWRRRVIIQRLTGLRGTDAAALELDELVFLLESGPDRIGGLDFQASASVYRPRERTPATLDELLQAAIRLERGDPLSPELALALRHGTSVGGARPKVLLGGADAKMIAKLSTSSDPQTRTGQEASQALQELIHRRIAMAIDIGWLGDAAEFP